MKGEEDDACVEKVEVFQDVQGGRAFLGVPADTGRSDSVPIYRILIQYTRAQASTAVDVGPTLPDRGGRAGMAKGHWGTAK